MANYDFDKIKALKLVKLCIESYKNVNDITVNQYGLEMVKIIDNEKTDIQGFIAKDENALYIVFRGADTIKDYLRDLDLLHVNFPKSKGFFFKSQVHSGFFKGYESVKEEIFEEIRKNNSINKIIVTGHSMGAALAVYCAVDIKLNFKKEVQLYTYGCPETGNRWFVKKFRKIMNYEGKLNTFRIVNDEDIVPRINILGLQHYPHFVFIGGDGTLTINPSKVDMLKEMVDDILSIVTGEAVIDHLSKNYLNALEKIQ